MGDKFTMTTGQAHELTLALARNGWTGADVKRLSEGDMAARLLLVVRGEAVVTSLSSYPIDGEIFELTINNPIAPLDMVRNDGYNSAVWHHKGTTVAPGTVARFKWVSVEKYKNWDELQSKLLQYGKIPPGQWREAVKAKFGTDCQHPRGIADASWTDVGGDASFPYLSTDGNSDFAWANSDFHGSWRWLVQVS